MTVRVYLLLHSVYRQIPLEVFTLGYDGGKRGWIYSPTLDI